MDKNIYKRKRNYNQLLEPTIQIDNNDHNSTFKNKILPKLNYSINIARELELNNYNNMNLINDEDKKHLYDEIHNNTINIYITKINNIGYTLIPKNYFTEIEINEDGNCFFNALSKFLSNNQKYHLYIRNLIYNYININKESIQNNNPYIHNNHRIVSFDEYLPNILNPGNYAGELEIFAACKVFKISIYVYECIEKENKYRLLYNYISEDNFLSYCMILNHKYLETGAEHFNLLKINNNFNLNLLNTLEDKDKIKPLDINNNYDQNKQNINSDKDKYIMSKKNYTKLNANIKDESSVETNKNELEYMDKSSNKSINTSSEIKDYNTNFIIDEFTDIHQKIKDIINSNKEYNDLILQELITLAKIIQYPNYNNIYKGDNYYLDKYLYLLSSKLFDKLRIYPKYIDEELDPTIKENKKRNFRSSLINYELDTDFYLCYLHTKTESRDELRERRDNNNHLKKNINEFELYRIPTVSNIIKLLYNIHCSILHQGENKMMNKINELKIYYKGISSDIKGINDICEVCIQKNIKFYKRQPCKQIIMAKPKERYVIDLTHIPNILTGNTGYKYLFNILDHFSKFLISYALKDKAGKTIANLLNKTFNKYGKPEQLLSDNGSEFTNKNVKSLVDKKGISFIHSKPYNPHSQGTVERVHRTVRDALICKYLENSKKFNLINSLNEVVYIYNNTIHKTTKYKPYTIFNNDDENINKEVFINTVNAQKNYEVDVNLLKINDTVLIFNNIEINYVKKSDTFFLEKSRIKRKNALYNICGTIIGIETKANYRIIIEKNYPEFKLEKYNICIANMNILKKIDYNLWHKILNK